MTRVLIFWLIAVMIGLSVWLVSDDGDLGIVVPPVIHDASRAGTEAVTPREADPEPLDADAQPRCFVMMSATTRLPDAVANRGNAGRFDDVLFELGLCRSRDEVGAPVFTVELDQSGKATVGVPWHLAQAVADADRPLVWLRASGEGVITTTVIRPLPEESGGTAYLHVNVRPGVVVTGRIVDEAGQPVAGDVLWVMEDGGDAAENSVGRAGPDGFFSGELSREGVHRLLARGTSEEVSALGSGVVRPTYDRGTGMSDSFEVTYGEDVPVVEIVVSGPGVVRGQVMDTAGRPMSGLNIGVSLASVNGARPLSLWHQGAGGLAKTEVTTDAQGIFVARGLRVADFVVDASSNRASLGGSKAVRLTPLAVPSDGRHLTLTLSRPHLAIYVRRADGTAVGEGEVSARFPVSGSVWAKRTWPTEPGVAVTLTPEHVHRGFHGFPSLMVEQTAAGKFVADLSALDVTVDVGVFGGGVRWSPVRVEVPRGVGWVDVDLVLRSAPQHGTLVLNVVNAQGGPAHDGPRIRIVDPQTGVVMLEQRASSIPDADWPWRLELPAGDYLVVVEDETETEMDHGTIVRRRRWGAFEQHVSVGAGFESLVTATLSEPARLTILVEGAATDADRAEVERAYGGRSGLNKEEIERYAAMIDLRLEQPGRWPDVPDFARYGMRGTTAVGTHVFSYVYLGEEETSEPLSAGSYLLVATTPSGRAKMQDVTFVPGETLRVVIDFD